MADRVGIEASIAQVEALLRGGDDGLASVMADDADTLGTPAQARRHLLDLLEGLEDVRAGRIVPHDQIVRETRERRQGRMPAAE